MKREIDGAVTVRKGKFPNRFYVYYDTPTKENVESINKIIIDNDGSPFGRVIVGGIYGFRIEFTFASEQEKLQLSSMYGEVRWDD